MFDNGSIQPPTPSMTLTIRHHLEQQRFETVVDGRSNEADYRIANGVMQITHTGVAPELRGHGIAAALVQAALDHARSEGLKVDPLCSYAAAYMRRHPQTLDLLA